jgi:hypothetical protein
MKDRLKSGEDVPVLVSLGCKAAFRDRGIIKTGAFVSNLKNEWVLEAGRTVG